MVMLLMCSWQFAVGAGE